MVKSEIIENLKNVETVSHLGKDWKTVSKTKDELSKLIGIHGQKSLKINDILVYLKEKDLIKRASKDLKEKIGDTAFSFVTFEHILLHIKQEHERGVSL